MDPILSVENLSVGYGRGHRSQVVLRGIDLILHQGEVVSLLGPNGAGKSTLLRTVAGEQPPLSGKVTVDGRSIVSLSYIELAQKISVVYTERAGAGALTVEEVVTLGRMPYTGFFGRLDPDDMAVVNDAMCAVGVNDMACRYMATLSDGERQKVMVARALAQQTPVMLLDEPTSFLDVASRIEIMELMSVMAHEHGKGVVISTHDVGEALNVSDSVWLIGADGNVACGSVSQVIESGAMDKLFVGRKIRFDRRACDYRAENSTSHIG